MVNGKFVNEFEEKRKKGNALASQLRSHVNKKVLSSGTKLAIHGNGAIFRPTISYGSRVG